MDTPTRHKHLANQNWPCGTFLPFDESEAESLGDGLIDQRKNLFHPLSL